ncbi:MAG: hypothetical protein ACOY0T_33100 [Myxococcota bacterium]
MTHAIAGCGEGLPSETATIELTPLGDFAGPARTSEALGLLESAPLDFPRGTRAVTAQAFAGNGVFLGYGERTAQDSLDLLLWPEQTACRLDQHPAAAPSFGEGQGLGFGRDAGMVLVVGGNSPMLPAGSVAATTFDVGNGRVASTSNGAADPDGALAEPRAFASVTALGEHMLVAGGEDPLNADGSGLAPPSKTAELFDPSTRRFASTRVELTVARSRHSALTLANGDTLLVGGRGPSGNALNALEVVARGGARGSIQGLAALKYPRLFPSALLLDDERVFVGGGVTPVGTPLSALEWLTADAKENLEAVIPAQLPPRHDRAFAALPGGGVLAVGGCQPSAEDCGTVCRAGCPPREGPGSDELPQYDAWWIAPDGVLTRLPFNIQAPRPVLLGGADGMPVLASGAPGDVTLYRFDPWLARFTPLPFEASSPPRAGLAATALDDGAFVWLAETENEARLFGVRTSTRNRFAIDENLVSGATSREAAAPYPLVPDRHAPADVHFDENAKTLFFEAESNTVVYVAATDYQNFNLELTVEGEAPRVMLGTREFGGVECPWPTGATAQFELRRVGERVLLRSGKAAAEPCAGPIGRVRLGVKRGQGAFGIRHFAVTREPE